MTGMTGMTEVSTNPSVRQLNEITVIPVIPVILHIKVRTIHTGNVSISYGKHKKWQNNAKKW